MRVREFRVGVVEKEHIRPWPNRGGLVHLAAAAPGGGNG